MPNFPFKRPRIISKKFPQMDSTIDGVTKSLDDLVFAYSSHVEKTLQKKHVMMAISSLTLILVLGSFISPKGKAESSIFFPENCLGGWVNPQYAQGEVETTSNGDEAQFTKHNSAVLPKNTNAEMYCGNFKGKFDQATKPTKIIVSLALTKGPDLLLEDTIESGIIVGTTTEGSSTQASITEDTLLLATSTVTVSTSPVDIASSSQSEIQVRGASSTVSENSSTATETLTTIVTASATPALPFQDTTSALNNILDTVKDNIINLFENNKDTTPVTDTVVVPKSEPLVPTPPPSQTPTQVEATPTSMLAPQKEHLLSYFFQRVFAEEGEQVPVEAAPPVEQVLSPQEEVKSDPQGSEVPALPAIDEVRTATQTIEIESASGVSSSTIEVPESHEASGVTLGSTTLSSSTTIDNIFGTEVLVGSSSESTTTAMLQELSEATTSENQFQNNFLEVFYTFDGVTWISLGELNEISMKYRTFEIPVTASTSWDDLSHLQVKLIAKKHDQDTPTVYLDGIKVEVLYETDMAHMHPDFARDTILNDEIIDGVRIVRLINNENREEEIWYMYLEDVKDIVATENGASAASSTLLSTSSPLPFASSTALSEQSHSEGTSTLDGTGSTTLLTKANATTSQVINLLKNKWKKYTGKDITLSNTLLVVAIRQHDVKEEQDKLDDIPNFALDTIKKIKGITLKAVVVQIERALSGTVSDELWLYNGENDTEEKIGQASSTTISPDSPLAIKDGNLFWISLDKDTVYAYNLETKVLLKAALPPFDGSEGKRAEVLFDGIPWKVIIGADGFAFYSDATGEVFSDDNGSVVEEFRRKHKLDTMLDQESLSNLNLQVEATSTETQ